MELRIDMFREQMRFPEKTGRRKGEERGKKGYNTYTTPTQHLYRSYLDHFWTVVIVIVFGRYGLTSSRSHPLHGEKSVKTIYSLKNAG